jgi:hypothetical protein
MADDNLDEQPESWQNVGKQVAAGAFEGLTADTFADIFANGGAKAAVAFLKFLQANLKSVAELGGKALAEIEDPILPIFGSFVAPIVSSMFGTEASPESFSSRGARGGRSEASAQLVDAFMSAIAGDSEGEIGPGDEGAKRIAGAGVHAALEGWFNAWILEMLGDCVPWHWLKFHDMAELPEEIIRSLGVGRLVRRAIAPLVDATASTPMRWQANQRYRPNLLSEGEIIRAFLRGDYSGSDAAEELSRLGYSDRRQELMIKTATKRLSLDDVMLLVREGTLDRAYALQNLRDEGYDDSTADYAVTAAEARRYRSIVDDSLAALTSAYIARDLTDAEFATFLPGIVADGDERTLIETSARARRDVRRKHLSSSEVVDCIKRGILPQAFYRDWLAREGYTDEEATALELRLIAELDDKAQLDAERERIAQEKAAARAAADAARAARLAAVDAERAARRLGSMSDLTRAVVRGLIPIDRLQRVLALDYDPDTVRILSDLALDDRTKYAAQQQAAADARKRAASRSIDVGGIEAAVMENVLSLADFRARLDQLRFTPADADLLTATLAARKKDADAAAALRADAAARAKTRSIDLGRAETLVIRGHGTLAQYDALLVTLGYDDASRAAMVDLLRLRVDDYQKAQQLRARDTGTRDASGLTIDDVRRGVVLGLRPIADYDARLVRAGYSADAVALLVATTQADADAATIARKRRGDVPPGRGADALPIAVLARAVRFGFVDPGVYQARLAAVGYSGDEIAIEMDLLTVEIATTRAQQQRREQLIQQQTDRGLTLQQLAAAVRAGEASIDDYRGRAAALGYTPADVDLLVAVLADEVTARADAEARRVTIDGELAARQLSLGELEKAVGANLRTLEQYRQQLVNWGYSDADAQVLASLLGAKLAAKGGA